MADLRDGAACVWLCLSIIGCSSSADDSKPDLVSTDVFTMSTDEFTLAPGDEKYLCFTKTVDDALYFKKFSIAATPGVHHMFFARTLAPEPNEPFECNMLFKPNWLPLFTTGSGAATLEMPEDSSAAVDAGSQLLIQVHLQNSSDEAITQKATVVAELAGPDESKYNAVLFPFGTTVFTLPPLRKSSVVHDCVMHKDMQIFAAFPHMHLLGQRMTFEVGSSPETLKPVYETAWDFNNQVIEPASFTLRPGEHTRTTCFFDNTRDDTITYGESTLNEMCFLSVFIKDGRPLDGHCVDIRGLSSPGGGTVPAECKDVTANELGLGAPCNSATGGCGTGLSCTSELSGTGGDGICILLGKCSASAECGTGGTCCAPAAAGGALNICVPEMCRPSDCAVKP